MSTPEMVADATRSVSQSGIETAGIEIISDEERTAKPHNLFLPWFASNISVFGMSYGAWVLGFGISSRRQSSSPSLVSLSPSSSVASSPLAVSVAPYRPWSCPAPPSA